MNYLHFTKDSPALGFLYEEDFISAQTCQELMQAYERSMYCIPQSPDSNQLFVSRVHWSHSLPDSERAAQRILQECRFKIHEKLIRFFNITEPLYSDSIQLVKWPEGFEMGEHADNAYPDDGRIKPPHKSSYRDYASIVYLNDNFDGGELFIGPLGIKIKPKPGLLIAIKADYSHSHGVLRTTNGERYTMPGWFTHDIRHRDETCDIRY